MAVDVNIKMVGDKALQKTLKTLKEASVRKIVGPAMGKGATVVNKEAKRLVPVRFGQLKKSIGKKRGKAKAGHVYYRIMVRPGFAVTINGKRVNPSKYAHLVEFGTKKTRAHSFLRAGLANKEKEARSIITRESKKNLDKEARKAYIKGKAL